MSRGVAFLVMIGVSLFLGMMIGWVAPLAFPPIAQIAQPFVCPDGALLQDVIRGQSGSEITYNSAFQCVSETGAAEDVTAYAILTAMGLYSAIAFVLLYAASLRMRHSRAARLRAVVEAMDAPGVSIEGNTINMRAATLETKLDVLATLRTQALIDEATYETLVARAKAKARGG